MPYTFAENLRGLVVAILMLVQGLLIIRIVLSWLPTINWYAPPWRYLDAVTEPLLAPFRKLIPPLGGIDFSPIVLFFVLSLLIRLVATVPL